MAEVAFDFEYEAAYTLRFVLGFVGDELLGEGIHAATRLAGAHCSQDCDAGVEATLRDRKPVRVLSRDRLARVVNLADDEEELVPVLCVRIGRQSCRRNSLTDLQGEDVQAGKKNRKDDVGRREEHHGVAVFRARIDERGLDGDQPQEEVPLWERQQEVESHPCCRSENEGNEVLRVEDALNHDFFAVRGVAWESDEFCERSQRLKS